MQAIDIIRRMERVYPEAVNGIWKENCCLAASRVLVNLLESFRISAYPLPAQCIVYNGPYQARLLRGQPHPKSEEEAKAWGEDGCWSVSMGFPDEIPAPDSWEGHMVVIANSPLLAHPLLLDFALGQAHRPEKGIVLPRAFVGQLDHRHLEPPVLSTPLLVRDIERGALLAYQRHPKPPRWEHAPDWLPHRHDMIELRILRAMERGGVPIQPADPLRIRKRARR